MTNEQLIRQYYDGDEAALEKLYLSLIHISENMTRAAPCSPPISTRI